MWDGAGETTGEYRVLARKYRPMDFSDLIGQAPMVRTLTNAFETGRIAQAYMLTGVRGVGKTTTARILARALNYKTETVDQPTIDLSVAGEHCRAIVEGRHVDVIEMDAASHTGIDDIREIIEQVRYRPVSARYKVYIIDEVHMLSTQAFNGLLKTLEEPPEHVKFIFATTEIRKVPITVLSRCQRFDLRRIDAGMLVEHFRRIAEAENVPADDLSLAMIARAAEGSARDGLSLMDQAIAHGGGRIEADAVRGMLGLADRGRVIDLFERIAAGDVAAALDEFAQQYQAGANPPVVLTDLADFTHLVTRLKFVPDAAKDASLSEAERTRGAQFAEALGVPVLSRLWQMLLKGIGETETSSRPYASAEMVLIRLAHAANLPGPEDAARRLVETQDAGPKTNGRDARPPGEAAPSSSAPALQSPMPSTEPAPARMTMAAPNPGAAALRKAEPDHVEEPAPTAMSPLGVSEPLPPTLQSVADIVELAAAHRDIKLKTLVRNCLRLVSIEPGRIEAALTEDTPKTFLGDLGVALEKWTGQRWVLAVSRAPGAPTLAEIETEARDTLVRDARQDPDVVAILERFPGARVTDVRIAADDTPELTVQSADGDVLPETGEAAASENDAGDRDD
jgi:DNA polymerase III subunit gamma/tau